MILKNFDLDKFVLNYKDGVRNILKTKDIKALEGEIFIIDEYYEIKQYLNEDGCDLKKLINLGEKIYFPFVNKFDFIVKTITGDEFDLEEGLEPEWLEGVGYIDGGARLIDIGDITISHLNIPGFILCKDNNDYSYELAEHIKGNNNVKKIVNGGLLGIDIKKFLEK